MYIYLYNESFRWSFAKSMFIFKGPKSNLNLNFHQTNFWFEFLDIHVNEKTITCHDVHGFEMVKHIYISNFDHFVLHFDTFFGSLNCDYNFYI
jgi:hypothetical protein